MRKYTIRELSPTLIKLCNLAVLCARDYAIYAIYAGPIK